MTSLAYCRYQARKHRFLYTSTPFKSQPSPKPVLTQVDKIYALVRPCLAASSRAGAVTTFPVKDDEFVKLDVVVGVALASPAQTLD